MCIRDREDGFQVRVELVEQTDERLWVPAGIATFDIKINSSKTGGHCDWNVALSNGAVSYTHLGCGNVVNL